MARCDPLAGAGGGTAKSRRNVTLLRKLPQDGVARSISGGATERDRIPSAEALMPPSYGGRSTDVLMGSQDWGRSSDCRNLELEKLGRKLTPCPILDPIIGYWIHLVMAAEDGARHP